MPYWSETPLKVIRWLAACLALSLAPVPAA